MGFGDVTINGSTLTLNDADQGAGGAIFSYSSSVTITNSIVAGNTDDGTAPDVRKSPADAFTVTNSLIGRNNGTGLTATSGTTPGANGNLIGGNTNATRIIPGLGALANNGGPTQTHALLINSPAIDRGSNALAAGLTTDQRGAGFSRIQFGIVDMGALEFAVLDSPKGTTGTDAFVLTYSETTTAGTVNVTISTGGGPVTNLGTFPMNSPLTINGLGGTDSLRIVGTNNSDTITVNSSTSLIVNGAALTLTSIETRTLAGAAGSDTYRFDTDAALGLWMLDEAGGGIDTLDFSLTTNRAVVIDLSKPTAQVVNAGLTLTLSSGATLENVIGGSQDDILSGNSLANSLTGGGGNNILVGNAGKDTLIAGTGRDILIGGLGLDTLSGGGSDDILIAGRTTSDANVINLRKIQTQWISANPYQTRIANLRTGVGVPQVSLKAKVNVLNDAGEDDSMTGGTGTDWYFRANDDAITDLFAGEIIDKL